MKYSRSVSHSLARDTFKLVCYHSSFVRGPLPLHFLHPSQLWTSCIFPKLSLTQLPCSSFCVTPSSSTLSVTFSDPTPHPVCPSVICRQCKRTLCELFKLSCLSSSSGVRSDPLPFLYFHKALPLIVKQEGSFNSSSASLHLAGCIDADKY